MKIDLVDFNNDGLLDIAMSGYATGIGEIFNVYQNIYTKAKGLNFINVTTAGLQPVENTKTTWGDFNGDGYPDVIFSGDRDGYGYVTKMAISSKDTVRYSQFNELPTFPFGNYTKLTPSMGDIGGDGHLGFVLVGSENYPLYQGQNSQLYKSFRILRNVRNYSAVVSGNAVAAETSTGRIKSMSLAANKTSTVFNNIKPLNISSLLVKPYASDSTQLDSGLLESSYLSNDAPTIPVLYKLNVAKKRAENKYLVQFNWKPSTDDKTPSDGLTYSLSVGTASNLSDIVNVESDLATGIQKKPQPGNVGKDTSWQISLPPGKYYYSVQSIDAAYEGSKFSDRQMFTLSSLGVTKEVTPPSDILFNDSARAKFYFRKGDSTNFNVKLRAISKDTTSKYTISLVTGSGTNAIFSFNSTTNVLTLKGKLTDTLYMLTVKAADSLGSELVKSYSIYVRQSADKILLNSVDTSIIRYKTGVDSAGIATGLLAAYNTVTSNANTNFTYKLVAGAGDFNNGSFSIENDVLVNTKKLTSADTLSVRVTALDDYGLNTDKIIKFVSNCTTKPNLIVSTSTAAICSPGTINIADTVYRKGSTGAFAISYFADQNEQTLVADPTKVAKTGTYYIKAIDSNSCSVLKPLAVAVNALPIAPIASPIALCTNTPSSITTVVASAKSSLNWYGTAATGGTAVKTAPVPSVTAAGVTNYYVSQTDSASGCEGPRAKLAITVINTPVIARDTAGFLIANAVAGNKWYWYKDATLVDSSAKFKPTGAGSYTVKSMENACKSQSYYYLVTDVINLSATEYIKLAPNPFVNFLNFDFVVNGYQKLNIDVFETSTGNRVSSKQGIYAGSRLSFAELSAGVYIFKVSSSDGKLSYQFKMIKL
ncbi:MAG: FG-GAP-like repeat-containing protein [Bacteroidetes bacterium]|nr:FG-GAP-like repeat-containing protein [Bacteroidota bacterium]